MLVTALAGTLGIIATSQVKAFIPSGKDQDKLAILGGEPVRTAVWPEWPV